MRKFNLRRPGVCVAAAAAFVSLVSATPGFADTAVVAPAVPLAPVPVLAVEAPVEPTLPVVPEAVVSPQVPAIIEAPIEVEPASEHIGDGEASYYGYELAGNRTASGERFNPKALTAAHRTLPLGTKLRVINKLNGKSVIVRINDRGPFVGKRLIDVSLGAAQQINMVRAGKAAVRLELLR